MAKVTIVIEDTAEGIEVSSYFEPELPPEVDREDFDDFESLTDAQLMAIETLDFMSSTMEDEEDEEEGK